jgi:hypothetical protein
MLINKSTAMRAFTPEQMKSIVEQARDPDSEKAQIVYSALVNEQNEYKLIRREYIDYTGKVMANFENEVQGIKVHEMREARERAEKAVSQKEQETAKNILNNLT